MRLILLVESLLVLLVESVLVRLAEVDRSTFLLNCLRSFEGLDDVGDILDTFSPDYQKLELLVVSNAYLGYELVEFLVLR